jgi:LPXTG-motif cell wall-anchored protein
MLIVATLLAFASAAQAQTPAEDQYGSPTGSSMTGSAQGSATVMSDGGDPGPGGSVASSVSAGESSEAVGGISGGALPSTGGAPIYLALAGAILLGTGATLWLRFRAESQQ